MIIFNSWIITAHPSSYEVSFTGLPVIANGRLHDVILAESLLEDGHADLISIGRAAIANPDWPKIIAAGEEPVPFQKEFIKPSLTLQHTLKALKKYTPKGSGCPIV